MSFASAKDDNQQAGKTLSVVLPGSKPDVFLGRGSKIIGTLQFTGTVEIEGVVEGEIRSEGKLILGEGAEIKARVQGVEVIVRGKVFGDISATKRLVLQKPANITGNLVCNTLVVEEGVILDGKISMNGTAPAK